MNRRLRIFCLLCTAAAVVAGCGGAESNQPAVVVFHFKMRGDATGLQDFRASATDATLIATVRQQLQLPENQRSHIAGPIDRGNGGVNLAWNWHFIPDHWKLEEVSIELCDGNAVLVSQAVDYWIHTVGQFCPIQSYVAYEVAQNN